jgi:ubiquinone/menaquinone biosynthesis C-methylase UbiE
MNEQKQRQIKERKLWLKYLRQFVRPGKIVEFGCGSGFILETLAKDFLDSTIIGIDRSYERLKEAYKKGLNNVILVEADITQKILPDESFDTNIFVGVLHELFSAYSREKVADALRIGYNALKKDGILIIQDFLKPISRQVEMFFNNKETEDRFFRFSHEFRPRKVHFKRDNGAVEIDITDAVEFISKYRSPNEQDWKEEMEETHFFFTEDDYKDTAQKTGFIIKDLMKLPNVEERWIEIKDDMEFNFENEYRWVQLVLIKK